MDSDDKKTEAVNDKTVTLGQSAIRLLWCRRTRVVLNMGSICVFSGVHCSIYAEVFALDSYASALRGLIIKIHSVLYIPRIMLGRRRHPHTALFIMHPEHVEEIRLPRQPILTND